MGLYLCCQPGAQRLSKDVWQAEEAVAAALRNKTPEHVLRTAVLPPSLRGSQGALHMLMQPRSIVQRLAQVEELSKGFVGLCQALHALQQLLPLLCQQVCTSQSQQLLPE